MSELVVPKRIVYYTQHVNFEPFSSRDNLCKPCKPLLVMELPSKRSFYYLQVIIVIFYYLFTGHATIYGWDCDPTLNELE